MEIIRLKQNQLQRHPIYQQIRTVRELQIFMEAHVFAVWDFMSILKTLQKEIADARVPWQPSPYSSKSVRLINEIVLGEESDLGPDGLPLSHFELYLRAMNEVGAETQTIREFIEKRSFVGLSPAVTRFVDYHLQLCRSAPVEQVAGSFFFGREDIIPELFEPLLGHLRSQGISAKVFEYYLARHIEVDGGEHGPMAQNLLHELCSGDDQRYEGALQAGFKSLELRHDLWNETLENIFNDRQIHSRESSLPAM